MSFLDDLKNQSRRSREAMFALCVFTSLTLIGLVWFGSFRSNLYGLLNPDQKLEQRPFADKSEYATPFASIVRAGKDLKASISNLLNTARDVDVREASNHKGQDSEPRLLPVSGQK